MDEAELSKLVLQLIEATAKLAATLDGVKETVDEMKQKMTAVDQLLVNEDKNSGELTRIKEDCVNCRTNRIDEIELIRRRVTLLETKDGDNAKKVITKIATYSGFALLGFIFSNFSKILAVLLVAPK